MRKTVTGPGSSVAGRLPSARLPEVDAENRHEIGQLSVAAVIGP
jgi:hypothetical protein